MMYWNDDHMTGWALGLMTAGMVVFWALLILGLVVLIRYLNSGRHRDSEPPEQLLAARLARGEIDIDEFTTRLDALHKAR